MTFAAPAAQGRLSDAEWLRREYVNAGRAAHDIADEIGCTRPTVTAWLRKHGIPVRTSQPRSKIKPGDRFGRLVVVGEAGLSKYRDRLFDCYCDPGLGGCGNRTTSLGLVLLRGDCRSCGCLRDELVGSQARTHGLYKHPLYGTWGSMRQRCSDPSNIGWENYGGRGISVCDRWLGPDGFPNFLEDMGEKPGPEFSIDRIDNDGNYEPSNCRWATRKEQAANRGRSLALVAEVNRLKGLLDENGIDYAK